MRAGQCSDANWRRRPVGRNASVRGDWRIGILNPEYWFARDDFAMGCEVDFLDGISGLIGRLARRMTNADHSAPYFLLDHPKLGATTAEVRAGLIPGRVALSVLSLS